MLLFALSPFWNSISVFTSNTTQTSKVLPLNLLASTISSIIASADILQTFLAIGHNEQSTFFEVKHSSQILKPDFRERFEEKQRVALSEFNRRLVLVTEKQIRMGPTLDNFKLLHRYSGLRTVTEFQKRVLAFIQRKQMVKLQEVSLYFGLSEQDTLISTLPWLSSGHVKTDLNTIGFGLETCVWC